MTVQKAFTLIELLVVVAIITLLVGILVPSMNVVKQLSRVAKCSTNINSALRDVLMYVSASNGLMPPYRYVPSAVPIAPEEPWSTTIAFTDEGTPKNDPDTGLLKDARNLGFVYRMEYINDYHVLYCPRQPKVEYTLEPYPLPWGMEPNAAPHMVLTGYMFNPNVEVVGSQVQYRFRPEVDTFPGDRPIICDLVWSRDVTSHVVGNEWRWNVGRLNGNVDTVVSREAQEYLDRPPVPDVSKQWADFNNTVYKWILMQ